MFNENMFKIVAVSRLGSVVIDDEDSLEKVVVLLHLVEAEDEVHFDVDVDWVSFEAMVVEPSFDLGILGILLERIVERFVAVGFLVEGCCCC